MAPVDIAELSPMLHFVSMPELPRPPKEPLPLTKPDTVAQVKEMLLEHERWLSLRGDNLLEFLEWALLLYGREIDTSLIDHLAALYRRVAETIDPEHRQLKLQNVAVAAAKYKLDACAFLPPLVVDEDPFVVATALVNYIALSQPNAKGLPRVFEELDNLFKDRTFGSPGAVLGGLVTLGDRRFHPKIHEWKRLLSEADIRIAAQCQTHFVTHGEIIFWLDCAEELVQSYKSLSKKFLASVASALVVLGENNPKKIVEDVERRFPAYSVDNPIVRIKKWNRDEYVKEIAERLYRYEAAEMTPKLFPAVLHAWDLKPRQIDGL